MKINKYNDKLNIIGEYIKTARENQQPKMSQENLSSKLSLKGITLYKNDIHRIETGKRTIKDFELIAICKILDIDINEFKKLID